MENAEKRLELIKMLRSEEKENIHRIQRREHILYPNRKVSYEEAVPLFSENAHTAEKPIDSVSRENAGFYLRFFLSAALFLLLFYMDSKQIQLGEFSYSMVQKMISDSFDLKSFAFMR